MDDALNADILSAHSRNDIDRLAQLYLQASAASMQAGNIDQACFFLTQAHIFALEAGSSDAEVIAATLKIHKRM